MKTVAILLALVIIAGCEDFGIEIPPAIPVAELLQVPDTISVDGKRIYLSTFMWRDFMPICPPDGQPLIAIVFLTTADSSAFPPQASADAIWIVYNNQAWSSFFSSEPVAGDLPKPYRYVRIVRDGPKWGPGGPADVIVRVFDSHGASFLLRAPQQWIGMTQ